MEKFVVFGRYCEDAINKREPFRELHLNRLKSLKDKNILVTLGPTKCTKYLFGVFNAVDESQIRDHKVYYDDFWLKNILTKTDWKIKKYRTFQLGMNSEFILCKK